MHTSSVVVSDSQVSWVTCSVIAQRLQFPEEDVIALAQQGTLPGVYLPVSNEYRFPSNAAEHFYYRVTKSTSSEQFSTHDETDGVLLAKSASANDENLCNQLAEVNHQAIDALSETEVLQAVVQLHHNESTNAAKKVAQADNGITLDDLFNYDSFEQLHQRFGRKTPVFCEDYTCLKLEVSNHGALLVVKTRNNKKDYRVVLAKIEILSSKQKLKVINSIESYHELINKLKRRPTQDEFNLNQLKIDNVGDVLDIHLKKNVMAEHGEGSEEWKLITSLIKNHLAQSQCVELPSGETVEMVILHEAIDSFTKPHYKAYLKIFERKNGVHDKIVSRIKAAFNYCVNQKLITYDQALPFINAKRLNKERHVVIGEQDLQRIFGEVLETDDRDFIDFMMIQATGHFRTKQVMSLTYEQFDLNNNTVEVTPKGGGSYTIQLPLRIMELVEGRRQWQISMGCDSDYVFPSPRSKDTPAANFNKAWTNIRIKLGMYTDADDKTTYKYRLHDFRETLIDRTETFDDAVVSKCLGHRSLFAIKNYRKANSSKVAKCTEAADEKMRSMITMAQNKSLS